LNPQQQHQSPAVPPCTCLLPWHRMKQPQPNACAQLVSVKLLRLCLQLAAVPLLCYNRVTVSRVLRPFTPNKLPRQDGCSQNIPLVPFTTMKINSPAYYLHRTMAEAHVRPAPKPARANTSPSLMSPPSTASASARGMEAALVFPYSFRLLTTCINMIAVEVSDDASLSDIDKTRTEPHFIPHAPSAFPAIIAYQDHRTSDDMVMKAPANSCGQRAGVHAGKHSTRGLNSITRCSIKIAAFEAPAQDHTVRSTLLRAHMQQNGSCRACASRQPESSEHCFQCRAACLDLPSLPFTENWCACTGDLRMCQCVTSTEPTRKDFCGGSVVPFNGFWCCLAWYALLLLASARIPPWSIAITLGCLCHTTLMQCQALCRCEASYCASRSACGLQQNMLTLAHNQTAEAHWEATSTANKRHAFLATCAICARTFEESMPNFFAAASRIRLFA
jgi:hypothetical protein